MAGNDDDRLSKLSDAVLGHILSFLPAFDAARAAVLSRRWRGILAAVHTLSLNDRDRPVATDDDDIFQPVELLPPLDSLVTAALLCRHRHGAPLRGFRVAFHVLYSRLDYAVVDRWVELAGGELSHVELRVLGLGNVICARDRRRYAEDELLHDVQATCGGEADLDAGDDDTYLSRAIPAPRRLFSMATLRSLRLGPCRLHLPPAIGLPCLKTLLLSRVTAPVDGVQRLVAACPRLADLTLEACGASLTSLRLRNHKRLRSLALRCCHSLTSVAVAELRAFEYRGAVPGAAFLTPVTTASCTLDFCGGGEQHLLDFLQLFAGVTHMHLKSQILGAAGSPEFPECARLRHLELTGIAPDSDATVPASVAHVLQRTPRLEKLSLFFLPDPLESSCSSDHDDLGRAGILDVHRLRYDRRAVPEGDGEIIPCLRDRIRAINLVHYQGGHAQRTLAKWLLRHALDLHEVCCVVARGPLWMQCALVQEITTWTTNKSANITFL